MSEPIIQIRNLHTRYGRREILKGITLEVYKDETMVILGFVVATMILMMG